MVKDIRIICTLAEATNYFEAGGLYVVAQSLYEQQLKKLKHKEQEYEELKKEIAFGNNGTLSDKIRAMVFTDLNKENNKLFKTLTDIKEIAEPYYTLGSKDSPVARILQKISEVIPDEKT